MSEAARLSELCAVAGAVSRETVSRLLAFEGTFRHWSRRINLAAPSQLDHLWRRHILDSAQLLPLAQGRRRWLDIGSGGGFPGAVVALLLADDAAARVDLVESNGKKVAFLKNALAGCPNAHVHALRIEDAYAAVPQPEIVTARALAPLGELLALAEPWLARGALGLFHKGRDRAAEIAEARDGWRFDLIEHRSAVDAEGAILAIDGLRARQGAGRANDAAE